MSKAGYLTELPGLKKKMGWGWMHRIPDHPQVPALPSLPGPEESLKVCWNAQGPSRVRLMRASPRSSHTSGDQLIFIIWLSWDLEPLLPRWVAGLGKGEPSHWNGGEAPPSCQKSKQWFRGGKKKISKIAPTWLQAVTKARGRKSFFPTTDCKHRNDYFIFGPMVVSKPLKCQKH